MLLEIINTHFQGWKRFCTTKRRLDIFDLSITYLPIEVDNKCSKLLTINTHRGIFKLNWLAFGIKVDTAIFQQVMDMMLSGLNYTVTYLDDILLKSENLEEHKKNVFKVFKMIQDYGLKLKEEKCKF